jgi:hypothetical protein
MGVAFRCLRRPLYHDCAAILDPWHATKLDTLTQTLEVEEGDDQHGNDGGLQFSGFIVSSLGILMVLGFSGMELAPRSPISCRAQSSGSVSS